MIPNFLHLKPTRYLCPYCGQWHDWPSKYDSLNYFNEHGRTIILNCPYTNELNDNIREFKIYFGYNCSLEYVIPPLCELNKRLDGHVRIESFEEEMSRCFAIVKFRIPATCHTFACYDDCAFYPKCTFRKLKYSSRCSIWLGFQFDIREYEAMKNSQNSTDSSAFDFGNPSSKSVHLTGGKSVIKKSVHLTGESVVKESCKNTSSNKEEETSMARTNKANKIGLLEQLYEHSPKENVALVKKWSEKYKPTLRWAIPVVGIYAAYRILNSKNSAISVDNIGDICEKELGFNMDCLKDKAILKELMVIGGISAGAYAAIKAGSAIFNTTTSSEVSVKDVEDGMEKLEGAHKKFSWIQPKTEKLLPVALSVIVVYIMTQKPANLDKLSNKVKQLTGDWAIKVNVFIEMAKLFISDKLHINLEDEDEMHKVKRFVMLGAIIAVGVFLYGKKVLDKRSSAFTDDLPSDESDEPESKGMKLFIKQVLDIMKKMMPAAFAGTASWLVAKKLLCNEDIDFDDISEDLRDDEEDESTDGNSSVTLEDFTEV